MFGEVGGVRLMPALAVWLADVAVFGLAMLLAAARLADRWSVADLDEPARPNRGLGLAGIYVLVVLATVKLALWAAVPEGIAGWPDNWRRYFNFLYPRPVFRPLILTPLWGRWALILASGIGRPAPKQGDPPEFAAGGTVRATLGWFLVVLVITAVYCGRHGRWMIGGIIGLAVLGCTFVFAVAAARRFGGRTPTAIQAVGLVGEITFLVGYLAASQHIYRY